MATEAKVVDTWTGEADLDGLTEAEELALAGVGLDSIALHGPVSEGDADRFIDRLLARLQAR